MNIETIRSYCLSKRGTSESLPFGPDALVFKVAGKMFALVPIDQPDRINLKCDPEYAVELRDTYPRAVFPGYHQSKLHWNTVSLTGGLTDAFIQSLIDHSYALVVSKLTKAEKALLESEEA